MKSVGLPDGTRLSQVKLRTSDLGRAVGFYRDVLGLVAREVGLSEAFVSASEGGSPLVVLAEDRAAKPHPEPVTGLYHLAIRFPTRASLAQALVRLARQQYPLQGMSDHLVSEAVYLRDADDNGVELYVDRPRSTWVWRHGQVAMATEPLDVDDLLKAAGDTPGPACPPPKTDLGHVHLHVADLADAERFYHEFLGLDVTQRSYPGALFLSAGGYHHHVAVNTWAGRKHRPENSVGLISYRLQVPVREVLYCLRHRAPLNGYDAKTVVCSANRELLEIRDPQSATLELECVNATTLVSAACSSQAPKIEG